MSLLICTLMSDNLLGVVLQCHSARRYDTDAECYVLLSSIQLSVILLCVILPCVIKQGVVY